MKDNGKISDIIESTVNRLPISYVFTCNDFDIEVENKEAAIKHLNRMVARGRLAKLSKGRYYKPEQSQFGQLPVLEYQVVKDLLEKDGKQIGYITGYQAFNELKLTTQMPFTITIATAQIKNPIQRGFYKIRFIVQRNTINKKTIPLLRLLDAMKSIKTIPDATVDGSIVILVGHLKELTIGQVEMMIRLAAKYTPSTRAILGAIIDMAIPQVDTTSLYNSLNTITKYKIGASAKVLPTRTKWRIE